MRLASDLGATSLAALRKLEPERFLKDGIAGTTHPIIDGYVVPEEPYLAFAGARQNDVPTLIGSNADEGRPIIAGVDVKLATFAEDLSKAFYGSNVVRDLAENYLKTYPATTLPYVFDHLSQQPWAWSDGDRAIANLMATCWTTFARSGDPNGDGIPVWPNFNSDRERVLHFDDRRSAVWQILESFDSWITGT